MAYIVLLLGHFTRSLLESALTFIITRNIDMNDITMTTISKTKCADAHLIKFK